MGLSEGLISYGGPMVLKSEITSLLHSDDFIKIL